MYDYHVIARDKTNRLVLNTILEADNEDQLFKKVQEMDLSNYLLVTATKLKPDLETIY